MATNSTPDQLKPILQVVSEKNNTRFLSSLLLREFLAHMLSIEWSSIHLQVALPSAIDYILMSANLELQPTSHDSRIRITAVLQVRVSTVGAQIFKSANLRLELASPDPKNLTSANLRLDPPGPAPRILQSAIMQVELASPDPKNLTSAYLRLEPPGPAPRNP